MCQDYFLIWNADRKTLLGKLQCSVTDNLVSQPLSRILLSKSCEDLFGTTSYGFDSSYTRKYNIAKWFKRALSLNKLGVQKNMFCGFSDSGSQKQRKPSQQSLRTSARNLASVEEIRFKETLIQMGKVSKPSDEIFPCYQVHSLVGRDKERYQGNHMPLRHVWIPITKFSHINLGLDIQTCELKVN